MLRSRTVLMIHDLAAQGKSIYEIARTLGIARNTVRKYLRGGVAPSPPRPRRPSKLDPFKLQIQRWIAEDHLLNCATMLVRLRALGYTGHISILKDFVQPLRPARAGKRPVRRYETTPGEQLQFDWGEFRYADGASYRKLFGFTAILSYSRMRFVVFTKRCDAVTLIRCVMAACEYFGGVPRVMLTDRMKSVLLDTDGTTLIWHPLFADFLAALGVTPRVCKPYTPQTKGKVERSIGVVKTSFWAGVHFSDLDDLNAQARTWCEARNSQPHATTRQRPIDRWREEGLAPLPPTFAWERFGTETRRVSWDGFLAYDGVLYGLPSEPPVAGTSVHVRDTQGTLRVWSGGQLLAVLLKRARSGTIVPHPDQFRTVPPASATRPTVPLGHLLPTVDMVRRPLSEYDQLYAAGAPA
jgi:transposase